MFLKGALVSFMPTFIGVSLPNVVIFQINPETITHKWDSATPGETEHKTGGDPLAVAGVPGEAFEFTLSMDSNEIITDGAHDSVNAAIAEVSGLYSQLAALEMLQYPAMVNTPLVGSVSAGNIANQTPSGKCGQKTPEGVPRLQVPTVLFVWGPGRIVPVRVTNLTVTEKLYDELLNPIHAEAQISMKVLTPDDVVSVPQPMKTIAKAAYTYTQALRQGLAVANLGGTAASLVGMLPISL